MLKIAICDDSPLFLEQARSAVLKWSDENQISTKLYIYENGDELIATNMAEPFHIILLDILMPLLNGMDTARELRQYDKTVKIIFLTSSPFTCILTNLLSLERDCFFIKPKEIITKSTTTSIKTLSPFVIKIIL